MQLQAVGCSLAQACCGGPLESEPARIEFLGLGGMPSALASLSATAPHPRKARAGSLLFPPFCPSQAGILLGDDNNSTLWPHFDTLLAQYCMFLILMTILRGSTILPII